MIGDDVPSPRAIMGRILGAATLVAGVALLLVLVTTRHIPWSLVTFVGVLWAAWSFFTGLFTELLEPVGRFFANQLTGNVSIPDQGFDIKEQTARLEHLLTQHLQPHHEILISVRLAEIYRTHEKDRVKSDALLARLRAKYPDAPELELADSG